MMGDDVDVDKRLTDLEVKLSLADDMLDQLSQTLFRQQRQIESLAQEIGILRRQTSPEGNTQLPSLRDELPPHY